MPCTQASEQVIMWPTCWPAWVAEQSLLLTMAQANTIADTEEDFFIICTHWYFLKISWEGDDINLYSGTVHACQMLF